MANGRDRARKAAVLARLQALEPEARNDLLLGVLDGLAEQDPLGVFILIRSACDDAPVKDIVEQLEQEGRPIDAVSVAVRKSRTLQRYWQLVEAELAKLDRK